MAGKIFYRKRRKIEEGEKKPRFRIVAVFDCNLKVYSDHLRLGELEEIAKETGTTLVELKDARDGSKKDKS